MLGALPAVLVLAEPCPRMVELEAWADWQGRQVKVERPHKLEAHKGPAEHPPPLAQVESRARGETPRRGATRATRLVDRVEPRRRALARVAVAAPSGASHGIGTNCCLLLLLRWDFRRDGGSVPAVRSPGKLETKWTEVRPVIDSPRRRSRSWHCLSARARFRSGRPPDSKSRLVGNPRGRSPTRLLTHQAHSPTLFLNRSFRPLLLRFEALQFAGGDRS